MLGSEETIAALADKITQHKISTVVVDPVRILLFVLCCSKNMT